MLKSFSLKLSITYHHVTPKTSKSLKSSFAATYIITHTTSSWHREISLQPLVWCWELETTKIIMRKKEYFTTHQVTAHWLVKSYGQWKYGPWKCHGGSTICFSLFQACDFPQHWLQWKWVLKTINVIAKTNIDNNFVWSILLSTIQWRNDSKMFKTLQWNHLPTPSGSTWGLNILKSFL